MEGYCMSLYKDLIKGLKKNIEKKYENVNKFAKTAKVAPSTVKRILEGERKDHLLKLCNMLETAGAKIIFEDQKETTRAVRFIDPKIIGPKEAKGPIDEDYFAVPLVSEAGASITGIVPQEEIKSWILVYAPALPARISQNLLAVSIAKNEFSMIPTLHPGDIVLIDRQDFIPEEGGIYLVRLAEPDWPITIKRVNLVKKNNHVNIVFSSDNPDKKEYPPLIYDFKEYDQNFSKAIIGRVVWAWSDMTKK